MKVLAIHTGATLGGVALLEAETLLAEALLEMRQSHSERLLPTFEALRRRIACPDWRPDLIAVADGPGPYTSLRIGVTAAKTLAYAWGVPAVGISTCDGIAFGFRYRPGPLLILLDARKEEVYAALYEPTPPDVVSELGAIRPVGPPRCQPLAAVLETVPSNVLIVGSGGERYRDCIQERLGESVTFADAAAAWCRPSAIGLLALRRHPKPPPPEVAHDLRPRYLRRSEAERRLAERESRQ